MLQPRGGDDTGPQGLQQKLARIQELAPGTRPVRFPATYPGQKRVTEGSAASQSGIQTVKELFTCADSGLQAHARAGRPEDLLEAKKRRGLQPLDAATGQSHARHSPNQRVESPAAGLGSVWLTGLTGCSCFPSSANRHSLPSCWERASRLWIRFADRKHTGQGCLSTASQLIRYITASALRSLTRSFSTCS